MLKTQLNIVVEFVEILRDILGIFTFQPSKKKEEEKERQHKKLG